MAEAQVALGEFDFAGDDHVVPFQVEGLDIRGRAVQLGPMLDQILTRHAYPPHVARLLGEMIVLTVVIGTSLKFEGRFTVQTKSDGPVDLLVVDFATPSDVRAYARYTDEDLDAAIAEGKTEPQQLLGTGILAFTIDQGEFAQPYQGIVALDGTSIEDIAGVYFRQSEQIPTRLRISVAELFDRDESGKARHHWRAGGVIAQFLPEASAGVRQPDLHGGDGDTRDKDTLEHDAWDEARLLLDTVEPSELTDPSVGTERLLYRLFHEHGVRVFESQPVFDRCRCSRDKLKGVMRNFTPDQIEDILEDGAVTVTCEFCSTGYRFEASEILS